MSNELYKVNSKEIKMKKYEVFREIYNPCAGVYIFDSNFPNEIETDDIEKALRSWIPVDFPEYVKDVFSDGSIVYLLKLPRMERYTFSEI